MASEARTIELTVMSATDLKKVKKFKRQSCYVVAYIYAAQRQATHVDRAGGVNPTWNAPMTLTCYETDLHPDGRSAQASSSSSSRVITIDIYSHVSGFFSSGDKVVGTVVVPLQHVAAVAQGEGGSMMSFDVHRPSGKVQGKLVLTLKLGDKQTIAGDPQRATSYAYHSDLVRTTAMMSPLVTSYNTTSGALSTQGAYDPNLRSFGKQDVVTGYPAAGYGFAPLGPLPAGTPQNIGQGQYIIQNPRSSRQERKRARRAQRAANPIDRKARRRKRLSTAALIVGGVILGMILL